MVTTVHPDITPSRPWPPLANPVADGAVDMRALCRHDATVLAVSGHVDPLNVDRVSAYATRCALLGNAVLLDLTAVHTFSARLSSLLFAVDEACGDAKVAWVMIASPDVELALRVTACRDAVPLASSVPEALRYLAHLAGLRRRVVLSSLPERRRCGDST